MESLDIAICEFHQYSRDLDNLTNQSFVEKHISRSRQVSLALIIIITRRDKVHEILHKISTARNKRKKGPCSSDTISKKLSRLILRLRPTTKSEMDTEMEVVTN